MINTDDEQMEPCPAGEGLHPEPGRARWSITESPTGTPVITAGASLDATATAELRREARALLARSVPALVVDLTAVRLTDPAAAAVLRDLAYEAGDADVDLRVVRDPGAPEMTRAALDDETLFELYPSLDAALRRPADGAAPPP